MATSNAATHLPARLIRPEPYQTLPRERLFRQLDEGRSGKVIWICAPGGSGKTVLASSYIGERGLDAFWYQLDEREADPANLFHNLALAAASRTPGQPPLPALTLEYLAGLGTYSRNFFERLYACIEPPGLIVLDNYQDVPADSLLHDIVRDAAGLLPAGLNLLVLSREPPPPCYARLQAHGVMTSLDWQTLRFDTDETRALASVHGIAEDQWEWIEHCHRQPGGWAAGLVLLLHAGPEDPADRAPVTETRELLFDYFAGEIFYRLPEPIRHLLIQAAPFPKLLPTALARLGNGADAVFRGLHRNNFLLTRSGRGEGAYEFHPLFRDFIEAKVKAQNGEGGWRDLAKRAAAILVDVGQHEDAIPLMIESADWEGLTATLNVMAPGMLMRGLNQSLLGWLVNVPDEVLDDRPWLRYWLGTAQSPFAPPLGSNRTGIGLQNVRHGQ